MYGTAKTELANARDATMFEKCMLISSIQLLDVRQEMFQRFPPGYIYCGSSAKSSIVQAFINRVGGHVLAGTFPIHSRVRQGCSKLWSDRLGPRVEAWAGTVSLAHDVQDGDSGVISPVRNTNILSPSRRRLAGSQQQTRVRRLKDGPYTHE